MPTITYIEHNGREHSVEVPEGASLMQGAVDNLVPGILGDCGGSCTCATCHAYVDEAWVQRLPVPSGDEEMMLDAVIDRAARSRLCCQLKVAADWEGLVVRLPETQA
ncbi:MAG TPA: 2Fe-2S iron-sulfur cluster-binding protein [Solimonas sp.]|nr:2Fe-2S iron-sulfur cluster-binding protein [Solimonas sp.]